MSLAKDLEIYRAADALLKLALKVQAQVPRAYRVAVGMRISNEAADILVLVARANAARGESRAMQLRSLLERVEAARVLLRAAYELKIIARGIWAESIELTDSVGKQANGWLSATTGQPAEESQPLATAQGQSRDLFSAAPAA